MAEFTRSDYDVSDYESMYPGISLKRRDTKPEVTHVQNVVLSKPYKTVKQMRNMERNRRTPERVKHVQSRYLTRAYRMK